MNADYPILWVIVTALTVMHYVVVSRPQGVLTLDGIFALSQWLMVTGTLTILEPAHKIDQKYAYVTSMPVVIYLVVSMLVYLRGQSNRPSREPAADLTTRLVRPTAGMWALLVFSAFVTVAYFMAVGYNVFLLGLRGTGEDYISLRLESYSGARYLFPGYVNQFRNVLLPLMVVAIGTYLVVRKTPGRWLFSAVGGVGILFAVLGTGQRGAFILFVFTLVTFLYQLDRKKFKRRASIALVAAAPPILFATLLLGRSSDDIQRSPSPLGALGILLDELWNRVFHDNQFSGQQAFYYIQHYPIETGREWYVAVTGMLPGSPGSSLARDVFAYIYGTDRGTAPISTWGSVYYNFGVVGLVLMAALMGVVFQVVTMRALSRPDRNIVELLGMSSVFVVLGNWVAGGPEYFLNTGLLPAILVWWMGRHMHPVEKHSKADGGGADPAERPRKGHRRGGRGRVSALSSR